MRYEATYNYDAMDVEFVEEDGRRVPKDALKAFSEGNALEN
jgi:hypothetical protein